MYSIIHLLKIKVMKKNLIFLFLLGCFIGLYSQTYYQEQVLEERDIPLQVETGFYSSTLLSQFLTTNEVQQFLSCVNSLGIQKNPTYNILEVPNDSILSLLYDSLIYYSNAFDSLINNIDSYNVFLSEDSFPINPILYVFNSHFGFSSLRSKIEAELLILEYGDGISPSYNPNNHYIVSDYMRSLLNTDNAIVIGDDIYLYGQKQQIIIPNKDFQNLSTVLSFWYNFGEFNGTFKAFKEKIARPIVDCISIDDLDEGEDPCDYMQLLVSLQNDQCPRTFEFEIVSHLGMIENITWDFGDNTTSTNINPIHQYEASGNYIVSIDINLKNGAILHCSHIIKVSDCIVFFSNPVSELTDDGMQVKMGLYPHHCDDDASIVSYNWSFGNGETSQEAEPTVLYRNDGSFVVNVTITYSDGCVASNSHIVKVKGTGNCCKNFSRDVTTVVSPDNMHKFSHTFSTYNVFPFHRIVVKTIHYAKRPNGNWRRSQAYRLRNTFGGVITNSTNGVCDIFTEIHPQGLSVYNRSVNNYDYGVGYRFRIRRDDLYSKYVVQSSVMSEMMSSDAALFLHDRTCR